MAKPNNYTLACLVCLMGLSGLSGCSNGLDESTHAPAQNPLAITVYKTPQCGCCSDWVKHVEDFGVHTEVIDLNSVATVKDHFNLPAYARSCHTAIYENQFVFEGHVPYKYMAKFMADPPPGSRGLTVPAMPVGSPGMEYENKFQPYQILLLREDGTTQVFAEIESYDQQF